MQRYKFKLEPLLFQRSMLEEQTQQKLAREQMLLKQLQDKLEKAFRSLREHDAKKRAEKITPADLQLHRNYKQLLLERMDSCKEKVREQRHQVEEIKSQLLKEHRETRVVEILKAKDMDHYRVEFRRWETRQLDEFSSIRRASSMGRKASDGDSER